MMQNNKYDIAIVGAGLVGSIAAALLAEHNFKILLLDLHPEPEDKFNKQTINTLAPELRMSAITLKSQEILEEINVWQGMQDRYGLMQKVFAWEEQGASDIILDSQLIGRNQLAAIVENNYLLELVNKRIKQFENISIIRSCKINNIFTNKNSNISVIECVSQMHPIDSIDSNEDNKIFSVDLVIGADGANSWLRNYFNFEFELESYNHSALVTNVYTEKNHNNVAYQKFLKQGPLAFLPWVEPNCSSIVWSQSLPQAKRMQNCSQEEFNLELEKAIDSKLGKILKTDTRITFPLVKRHINNYYKQGIVLVGDAAHTIHPLAGQGLNLGIYDVYELSKILKIAKQNNKAINTDYILNKYQLTRRGHNQQMINLMGMFKEFYNSENQNSKPISFIRNLGVILLDNFSFIKKQVTRFAAGYY